MDSDHCNFSNCERKTAVTLEDRRFCSEHFLFTCLARLDECERWLDGRRSRDTSPEAIERFIAESSQEATDLASRVPDLTNLEQARVVYILMWAGDLGKRLRKSPRKVASIPVRLSYQKLGASWEEDTQTVILSRHGTLVECEHQVEVGEALLVIRQDNGRQARARVAWQQLNKEGHLEIGIEFLDCENFWELE